jgi:hypothetical protein
MTGNVIFGVDAYVCCIKQGGKPSALYGIGWYHRMFNAIAQAGVAQAEVFITELNSNTFVKGWENHVKRTEQKHWL